MAKRQEMGNGRWWRFRRYELRDVSAHGAPDGRELPHRLYLCPAGRRAVEYSPWSDEEARDSALTELFDVVDKLRPRPLTDEAKAAAADWCSKYGPLGILLHEVERVVAHALTENDKPVILQRTATAWERVGLHDFGSYPSGELVLKRHNGALRTEDHAEGWGRYFPFLPLKDAVRLQPLSQDFWRSYCEPLAEFQVFAQTLCDAVLAFSQVQLARSGGKKRPRLRARVQLAEKDLANLTSAVSPVTTWRKGEFAIDYVSPSLIASLAMMASLNMVEQKWRRVFRCAACHKVTAGRHPAAVHCSERCATLLRQRRYRSRGGKSKARASTSRARAGTPARTRS